jgi:predicted nucleic acid-binding protein
MTAICLDSSGWIEIAEGGPNAEAFAEALEPSQSILSSVISLYEISKYLTREVGETDAQELLAFIRNYPVIAVTEDLALYAANLSAVHQLAMADALIYATARSHKATLWTQDIDFEGLPNVRYFPKIKP